MDVWGLTMDEARQRITDGYQQILRRPIVYLDLVEQRPVRVTVTGQVGRPGVFTLPVNSPGSIPRMESWEVVVAGPPWWM
jgi:polysaccharide export outer membrane protein